MSEVRRLPEPLTAYRIGDAKGEFPIWDDGGARKYERRVCVEVRL